MKYAYEARVGEQVIATSRGKTPEFEAFASKTGGRICRVPLDEATWAHLPEDGFRTNLGGAKAKGGRAKAEATIARYEHVVPQTLAEPGASGPHAGRWTVEIGCAKCGSFRRIALQDLFQVRFCSKACRKAAAKQ